MQSCRAMTTILAAAALAAAPAALAMQPAGSTQNLGGSGMARALARRLSRTNNDSEQAKKNKKHPYGLGSLHGSRRGRSGSGMSRGNLPEGGSIGQTGGSGTGGNAPTVHAGNPQAARPNSGRNDKQRY